MEIKDGSNTVFFYFIEGVGGTSRKLFYENFYILSYKKEDSQNPLLIII